MAARESYAPQDYGSDLRQVQNFLVSTDNREFQKVATAISEHTELLALLCFQQPLSSKEIRSHLGISKNKFQLAAKRLIKTGVLVQIKFEQHTLYVISSEHTALIESFLT